MKKNLLYLLLLIVMIIFTEFGFAQESQENDQCLKCHKEQEILPEGFNEEDIHNQAGLSCSGCHGGNPEAEDMDEAMDTKRGFVGVPSRKQIPRFCGKCHSSIDFMRVFQPRIETDQVQQYYTSVHGQKLQQGDQKVAECASCHTSHAILPVKDTRSSVYALNVPNTCSQCHSNDDYMKDYQLSTDQYEKYSRSVHGIALLEQKDVGAPACNDCHGNHGAIPPGITSISHVCGTCHVNNMNYFSASKMSKAFEESDIHGCEQCHGNHEVKKTSDDMIGGGETSVCIDCHTEGDSEYEMALKIHTSLKTFVDSLQTAETKLTDVQQKGMDDVDILFLLQEAKQDLIHTRTLVHSFDYNKINEKAGEGVTKVKTAITTAEAEINDYYTRRRGFGVAIIFIVILAIGLFLKIRDMEKQN